MTSVALGFGARCLACSAWLTLLVACGSDGQPDSGNPGVTGGGGAIAVSGSANAGTATAGSSSGGTSSAGQAGSASAMGGSSSGGAGGNAGSGSSTGGSSSAGAGGSGGAGGTSSAGAGGSGGGSSSCVPTKMWGTADPSNPGPFQVMTEENVGPEAGIPDPKFNSTLRHFNLYRPTDLSQGYCHPIVTWANGTNDQPKTYEVLIKQLASHGFVVVASLNSQTAQGTPLPQIVGIDWMIEQSNDPASPLYHHLDTAHIGATGHSQGGAATTMAGADPRITAIAPIAGSRANITLHGPAALLCGGMDTTVPCSNVKMAYDTISNVPVLLGDNLGDTHGSWIGSIKNPYMVAVTGWFRVHLMGDTENRGMFYGQSCKLCTDSHWQIERKSMDQ
jgi:hypothetical protein